MQLGKAFDVVVLAPAIPGAPASESLDGVTVERFRFFPRRWEDLASGAILENVRSRPSRLLQVPFLLFAETIAVRRAIQRHRPDVLHVHWLIPQGVACLIGGAGTPRVLTTLGGDLYALEARPLRWLKRRVVTSAAEVTVMNADMADRIVSLGADSEAVHVLPMGADVQLAIEAGASADRVDGRMVFAGRLVEKKGCAILIEAIKHVPAGLIDEVVIIGDGPLREELERAAADLPVTFTGQISRSEMMQLFATATVAAFPSVRSASGDQDGLPVAMLEAMAAGAAVVASNLPGIDEVIINDETGWLTISGDADDLATRLASVLNDPDRLRAVAAAGKQAVQREHSVEAVGSAYRRLFERVLGR